jgi:hypothetical protein
VNLKTRLDWQGYRLAIQNEETMGCSPEQTAMCVAISEYRDRAHEMQELLRHYLPMISKFKGRWSDKVRELLQEVIPGRLGHTEWCAHMDDKPCDCGAAFPSSAAAPTREE